jgi:hypothetical protein
MYNPLFYLFIFIIRPQKDRIGRQNRIYKKLHDRHRPHNKSDRAMEGADGWECTFDEPPFGVVPVETGTADRRNPVNCLLGEEITHKNEPTPPSSAANVPGGGGLVKLAHIAYSAWFRFHP